MRTSIPSIPSIPSVLFHALVLPLTAAGLGAQNLVTNGDFEGGTNTNGDPNGWTVSGYTVAPLVSNYDTTGGGATNSYNHHPGGRSYPNAGVNAIGQEMLIIQGVVHEFRADIASVAVGGNTDGGTVEVFVDGVSAGKHAFGKILSNTIERTRLCIPVVPKSTGKKKLRITFHRLFVTHIGTPTVHIDNIFFGRTRGLTVCFPGERKAGSSMQIQARGNAGDRFAIFIGVGKAEPTLPILGWTGRWELASPFFPLVIGNLDTSGKWSLSAQVPAAAKGAKAWVQGAQAAPTSLVVNLGFGQEVNVY